MAEETSYTTVQIAKSSPYLNITDSDDDLALARIIGAISRWIDRTTGRRFYASTETRYYTADWYDLLHVDDILSVTTLKTDVDGDRTYETTWATTDFDLEPYNAALMQPPAPYTMIRTTPQGNYSFPRGRKGVQVAGSWGYCTTANRPDAIEEACLLGVMRIWERHKAVLGVAGSADLGQLVAFVPSLKKDPDVMLLIDSIPKRLGVLST